MKINIKRLHWLSLLVFSIGMVTIALPHVGFSFQYLPGDLGDTRFNIVILEHIYRWLFEEQDSLYNLPIFYPHLNTLSYSDNHFGSFPFYAIWRLFSFDKELSFQYWFLISYVLNFVSCYWVLKKMRASTIAAAMGAFIFAFGLPSSSFANHVQLCYRFPVPLAIYYLGNFIYAPRDKNFFLLLLFTTWQFYISIYLGYFLTLLLFTWFMHYFFYHEKRLQLNLCLLNLRKEKLFIKVLLIVVALICLLILFLPYLQVAKTFGYTPWYKVKELLPEISNYFSIRKSMLWRAIIPVEFYGASLLEHVLFPGFVIFFAIIYVKVAQYKNVRYNSQRTTYSTLTILFLFTLNWGPFSFYKILFSLPGVAAIRAVSRINLSFLFLYAILLASCIDDIRFRFFRLGKYILFTIILMTFVENITFLNRFQISTYSAEVNLLSNAISKQKEKIPVLSISTEDNILRPAFIRDIDVMLASQESGFKTLNGYSGKFPTGYPGGRKENQCNIWGDYLKTLKAPSLKILVIVNSKKSFVASLDNFTKKCSN